MDIFQEDYSTSPISTKVLTTDFIIALYRGLTKAYQSAIDLESFNSLIQNNFALRELDDLLIIYLSHAKWESHDIVSNWLPESVLPITAIDSDIQKKIKALLTKKSYFNICTECGEFNSTFHFNGKVCHSCLENNHKYIF